MRKSHLSPTRDLAVRILGLCVVGLAVNAADTRTNDAQPEIPPLHPPLTEVPATFLERNGGWLAAGLFLVSAGVVAGVFLSRGKRPGQPVSAVETARVELAALAQAPEDGQVLTRASRTVKHYFSEAFGLGKGEMTTREFLNELQARESLPLELRRDTGEFLVDCDRRKFSPAPQPGGKPAVPVALDLVERAEKARLPSASPEQNATQPA